MIFHRVNIMNKFNTNCHAALDIYLKCRVATLFLLTLTAFLSITACTAPAPSSPPAPGFTQYPVININVANIELVEAYQSPLRTPNIEHVMPYSPSDAVKIWVKDRLRAVGSDKLMQVTILDASVVESKLPETQGIKGLFTIDQDRKYDAHLEVEMRIYGDAALSEANTSVSVTSSITVPENASVNSRKAAYQQMINGMMEMLNAKLEKNMREYMNNYISYQPDR